jgi:hypothetical protein
VLRPRQWKFLRMKARIAIFSMLAVGLCPMIGFSGNVPATIVREGRLGAESLISVVDGVRGLPAQAAMRVQRDWRNLFKLTGASAPFIASLAPTSGPIGTSATIQGSGFTPRDNNIQFYGPTNFLAGSPVSSESGTSLDFIVTPCPSREPQCPTFFVPPGAYSVIVINANGKSNEAKFTVTRP